MARARERADHRHLLGLLRVIRSAFSQVYEETLFVRHTSLYEVATRVAFGLAGAGDKLWA